MESSGKNGTAKKRFRWTSLLAALLILAAAVWVYRAYFRVQNVFDQMYYSRVHSDSVFSMLKNPRSLFENVPQLQTPARDADHGSI